MPIYEYQCTQCGEKFEEVQSISEDSSKLVCPKCGSQNPRRLFSTFHSRISSASINYPRFRTNIRGLPPPGE